MTDADDEARRLRSETQRIRDENADLRERLAYCWQHVEHLRARLAEVTRPMRTGEPVDKPGRLPASLEPVTAVELEAALVRLRAVRALPF